MNSVMDEMQSQQHAEPGHKPLSASADVAILLVSYNTAPHMEPCLRSLLNARDRVTQQVVVVDNASTDDSVKMIQDRFPDVELIVSEKNLGFGAAVNLAAKRADAEFVLLLNPDTLVLGHAVDTLVTFARNNPGLGLYGGRTVRRDGSLEPSSCWALPTLWSLAMFATGLSTFAKGSPWLDPESMGDWQRDSVREVGMVTGCLLLIPTAVWRELGGFDERYFMYSEDADLAIRARARGYRPTICPDAVIVHDVGKASATRLDKLMLSFTGRATLIRTHWSGLRRTIGLNLLLAGVGMRALLASLFKNQERAGAWPGLWAARERWSAGFLSPSHNSRR